MRLWAFDPGAAVAEIAGRVVPLVDSQYGTELVTTIAGGMALTDYLPTRTFELTVHTSDLAVALDAPAGVPATAAAQALRIVTDLAVADGRKPRTLSRGAVPASQTR